MQFPITREALQNFNREDAWNKKQKQQKFEFYRTLIADICKDIEDRMMGAQEIPLGYNLHLHMPPNFNPQQSTPSVVLTQYVWKDIQILAYWKTCINPYSDMQKYGGPIQCYRRGRLVNDYHKSTDDFNQALPEFIEMLKETFIGCDIIIDPLKTYLIIDWS
jgi:hypothetical protein